MISSGDIKWLAGLLEGEGCFTSAGRSIRFNVKMTDRDVVDRAASYLGAPRIAVRPRKPGYKEVYEVRLYGIAAASWMMTLYAQMGQRRRRAIRQALVVWRQRGIYARDRVACPRGHVLPPYVRGQWRECKACRADAARDAYRLKHGVTPDRWRKTA